MANPQKENGYTPIANEILEKLIASGLNGTEIAVILFILRKTYGYAKKQDEISISQFLLAIPITKQSLCTALKTLQLVKIIRLVKKGISKNSSNLWVFNKDYDTWQLVKKARLVKKTISTSQVFHKQLVKKTLHTKETIQKKDTKEILSSNDDLPFSFKDKLSEMFKSQDRRMPIIAYYWSTKGVNYENKEQYSSAIKRELKPAGLLKGYSNERIKEVCQWLKDNSDFKWTLESVHKYIDDDLKAIERGKMSEDDIINNILKK